MEQNKGQIVGSGTAELEPISPMKMERESSGSWYKPSWISQLRILDSIAVVLISAAAVFGLATYTAMSDWGIEEPNAGPSLVLLNIDLVILLGLTGIVTRRLILLWRAHRAGAVGSRLHSRLVLLFGALAVTPTVLMAVFSTLFFTFGVQSWFSERVQTAVSESAAIAQAYLEEHQQAIRGDALAVATDLNSQWSRVSVNQQLLNSFLSTQAAFRGLTEAVIFRPNGQVIARAGYTFALAFEQIPFQTMAQADVGQVAIVTGEKSDRVRALVKLKSFPVAYLYVGRFVDANVLARTQSTEEAVTEYLRLEGQRSDLQISLVILFSVVALLLFLVSIWFGLSLATRLTQPIVNLINATDRVRGGDLSVRVNENDPTDEVGYLNRAFNRMTIRLSEQKSALQETNDQLDERRRFTETVLEGVSAGVIGLDTEANITLPNRSASLLLGTDLNAYIGKSLLVAAAEFAPLIDKLRKSKQRVITSEIKTDLDSKQKIFFVRLSKEQDGANIAGYVLTFDDITALQSAQRKAAWADVARRIAHEIKNPLTPIQLSAERLKRKYLNNIEGDEGLFAQCTDTIIRHVGDIGKMVDEFSAFARMPAAVLKLDDLSIILNESVTLQRMAYPHIEFTLNLPTYDCCILCDARQVRRALTNVLKNAVESIDALNLRKGNTQLLQGLIHVELSLKGEIFIIEITDNGIGLPDDERAQLTEPYVTTRSKGTGLGLAIVKKIIEDHGGTIMLRDAPFDNSQDNENGRGAQVALHFPNSLENEI
ncbi:MAG: two-component sensor histidine kinase [Candidatus Marinimicrobia bacterium]|nr:two-component sensor histidine kinase [Candidatus Neomarinimicrobiota bacterium]